MKQKIVIGVSIHDQESRKKALTIVVGSSGVVSVALKGDGQTQIEITGDGVDVTNLAKLLRKKVGHAELVSVDPLGDKEESEEPTVVVQPRHFWSDAYDLYYQDRNPDPGCCIM